MKASDLRIGNYFNDPDGNISEVIRLNSTMINSHGEDECQPIPLTEEWLTKLGFNDHSIKLPHIVFDVANTLTYNIEDRTLTFGYYGELRIEYVHQLQNLFHSLTGEELTIKE